MPPELYDDPMARVEILVHDLDDHQPELHKILYHECDRLRRTISSPCLFVQGERQTCRGDR